MITVRWTGDFSKTYRFLKRAPYFFSKWKLDRYGQKGVDALSAATPVNTGLTASSWSYEIVVDESKKRTEIIWSNSNVNKGIHIAVILQYGHATGNGGYVEGVDYINPAMKPIFDQIAKDAWEEVTSK